MSKDKLKRLAFSHDWNKKLNCDNFTTIRISDRFKIGDKIEIFFKTESLGPAEIIGRKEIFIDDINEFIARIDTGYSAKETIKIIETMYPQIIGKRREQRKIFMYLITKNKKSEVSSLFDQVDE